MVRTQPKLDIEGPRSLRFWKVGDGGSGTNLTGRRQRWLVADMRFSRDINLLLDKHPGGFKGRWMPPEIRCEQRGPFEDVPWVGTDRLIVSERLREFLDQQAPGHAQFLPVRFRYRGKPLKTPPYFIANWLHELDCADLNRSTWAYKGGLSNPENFLFFLYLAVRKVPKDIHVFRVKHAPGSVIMRSTFITKMARVAFSGIQFYPVAQAGWKKAMGVE